MGINLVATGIIELMKRTKNTYCSTGFDNWFLKLFQKSSSMLILPLLFVLSCDPWDDTAEVSHVSYLPSFEIIGGEFLSYIVADSGEYIDEGANAYEKDKPLPVYSFGEVDLTKVGVYSIFYYAQNSDGLYKLGERTVSVAYEDVSNNDFSGKYQGTIWSPLTEMKVTKEHAAGLYKCSEVFGFPGSVMRGKFVDLGKGKLVLLHGKGDFGNYASSEGESTLSTLTWTVSLLDEPYANIDIQVLWRKILDE